MKRSAQVDILILILVVVAGAQIGPMRIALASASASSVWFKGETIQICCVYVGWFHLANTSRSSNLDSGRLRLNFAPPAGLT